MNLLEAVEDGRIFDPYDDLCGQLLETVYPEILSPPQVLPYLRLPKQTHYFGAYCRFWTRQIIEQSTNKQLGELLDLLAESSSRSAEKIPWVSDRMNPLYDLPVEWLEYYLENIQEEPNPQHLFHWLETVRDTRAGVPNKTIGNWLSSHPETLLEVYNLGIDQCANSDQLNLCMYHARERLSGATLPKSFGIWCLRRAVETTDVEIAQYLIRSSANFLRDHDCHDGLSLEIVEDHLSERADLLEAFTKHFEPEDKASDGDPMEQYSSRCRTERLERQKRWYDQIKPMQKKLRENRGHPSVLHELAKAYYGGYRDIEGNTPEERLEHFLGKDEKLIQTVLQAFRMSVDREDLPSVKEVMRLEGESQLHFLSYPYMAGLHEISKTSPDKSISLSDTQMRLALAIYYAVPLWPLPPHTKDSTPRWFPSLLKSQPEVIAESLVDAVRAKFRRRSFVGGLHKLAHAPEYEEVARMASLRLLKAFPVRGPKQQLQDLIFLLTATFRYCEKEKGQFLKIIAKKISSRSMHVAQKIYWLTAGLFAEPDEYQDKLESYITGNESRIQSLVEIVSSELLGALPDLPNAKVLSLLVRMLGTSYDPYDYNANDSSMAGRPVTLGIGAANSIQFLCKKLAQIPTREATRELISLLENRELYTWHPHLANLADQQKILRRENEFKHGTVGEVLQVIENAHPANSTDLAAITIIKLEEVAKDIRDGNTSDWRAYWTSDENDPTPQHEDFCRDRLLSRLRQELLPLDIDAQPEGRYANEKRSDIRLSCNQFNVPVEIKKSDHRDLWTAIRNQLIPKYARDPGANGNGIYLVLWFGKEFCKAAKSGIRPENPAQLKQYLLETLSGEEQHRIKVCVIDVSRQL